MATWFIRLGSNNDPADKNLYRALAKKYSIVKIGYDIGVDITNEDKEGIIEYLKSKGENGRSLSIRARLINSFIHDVKEGDIIICPFGKGTDKLRVGKVISECHTLESFFKGREKEFDKFLVKYPGSQPLQKIKPAREVEWITKEKSKSKFPPELQEELSKFMPATINQLKNEEGYKANEEDKSDIETVKKSENFGTIPDDVAIKSLIKGFEMNPDFWNWILSNISLAFTSAMFSAFVAVLFGQDSFNLAILAGFLIFVLGAIAGFYANHNKE